MNKIKIPVYIILISSVLFSLSTLSFSFDISLLAFPLSIIYAAIVFYFLYLKALSKKEFKAALVSRKLLQYICFVFFLTFILRRAGKYETFYWLDVVSVFLWCVTFVVSLIILHYFKDKRLYSLEESWKNFKKPTGKIIAVSKENRKSFFREIVDWIDALFQAIFMVLLIQIFVFQLYVIPSESMVPYFLIGDRVVVFKIFSGPKFPLSEVGLPDFKKYKRGDVVVFRNPHYSLDRKSEIKTVLSQIIYMLTFTGVNLNVDENGEIKADPLVKRICGEPGEQLVMQDGILYARTKENNAFIPVEYDSKVAAWNLNPLLESRAKKKQIQYVPLTQSQYDQMILTEDMKNNLDIEKTIEECKLIAEKIKKSNINLVEFQDYFNSVFHFNGNPFSSVENFVHFMTDWINTKNESLQKISNDIYSLSNYKLNLLIKLNVGKIVLQFIKLKDSPLEKDFSSDSVIEECSKNIELLYNYLRILDSRNMPVFPPNNQDGSAQYIPENCYFMMGDNRFNSLDMRHSYDFKLKTLSEFDDFSASYFSNMAPQTVNQKYILGTTCFRFMPVNRIGVLK